MPACIMPGWLAAFSSFVLVLKDTAERYWPIREVAPCQLEVRSLSQSGPDLLNLSSSRFDPKRSWATVSGLLWICEWPCLSKLLKE